MSQDILPDFIDIFSSTMNPYPLTSPIVHSDTDRLIISILGTIIVVIILYSLFHLYNENL
jgi:hypothetical protein